MTNWQLDGYTELEELGSGASGRRYLFSVMTPPRVTEVTGGRPKRHLSPRRPAPARPAPCP